MGGSRVQIVAVAVVRNEADVIEAFVRYHLRVVDRLVVIDHGSADATSSILAALAGENLPLEVVSETRPDFSQARVTTHWMRRVAREHSPRWVLPLDADEFLGAKSGSVGETLAALPDAAPLRIAWRTYVPRPQDPADEPNLLDRIRYRRSEEARPYYKVLVPGALAASDHIELNIGNHRLTDRSGVRARKLPGEVTPGLHLSHFPVRSAEQIATKSLVGWPARLAGASGARGAGPHVKPLFDRFRKGAELKPDELMQLALGYATDGDASGAPDLVLDPVVPPGGALVLRYGGRPAPPLEALADLAEGLALELHELRRKAGARRWWARIFPSRPTA